MICLENNISTEGVTRGVYIIIYHVAMETVGGISLIYTSSKFNMIYNMNHVQSVYISDIHLLAMIYIYYTYTYIMPP